MTTQTQTTATIKPFESSKSSKAGHVTTIPKETLLAAIEQYQGDLTAVSKSVGCSLATVYNHSYRDDEIKQAIKTARAVRGCQIVDLAESMLEMAVAAGSVPAIKYALATRGKERGYTEKQEIAHSGSVKDISVVEYKMDQADDDDSDLGGEYD